MAPIDRVRLRAVAASAPALALATFVLGAITPGYHPAADTISRLGSPGQPHATAAGAGLVLYGLAVVIGAGPLAGAVARGGRWLVGLVAAYGGTGVVAGLLPKDAPGSSSTLASAVHVAATVVGGAAILAAMLLVGVGAPERSVRRSSAAAVAVVVCSAITFRCTWGTPVYGAVERVLVGGAAVWLSGIAARSGRRSADPVAPDGDAGEILGHRVEHAAAVLDHGR